MTAGHAGRPRRPARAAADPGGAPRGDRPDHGRRHRAARGDPRRAGAGRALRPAHGRGPADRQPAAHDDRRDRRHSMTQGGGLRRRLLGDGVLRRARRRRQRRHVVGVAARSCAPRSTRSARTPTTCPASTCPTPVARHPRPGAGAGRRRGRGARGAVADAARSNLTEWADIIPRDALLVSLMKGVELGSLKRMSEVIAEVTGAGPERIGVVSGPNLAKEIASREPAASVVACTDEDGREAAAGAVPLARRSGPTPAPTSSAASSAAPTRTSSRSPSGWRSGSASATTPPRR